MASQSGADIRAVEASAYVIPTDGPEQDGTLGWDRTTLVVVELEAGGHRALGYTYADAAAADVVRRTLAPVLVGRDALDIPARASELLRHVRNAGAGGLVAMALSAVDAALWDLKGRLFGLPVAALIGRARDEVPVYGSGGFTNAPVERLQRQLGGWVAEGIRRVKMKVGADPAADPRRVAKAREAIGDAELFVDANGAYRVQQAVRLADVFAEQGVRWLEEPVSSDALAALREVRLGVRGRMDVAAGEYGDSPWYFRRMLEARAVDVLQADATRCLGVSGFLQADALCEAFDVPLSAHCAPALHAAVACCTRRLVHVEYFHDHARIERRFFDGAPIPREGQLAPDPGRPGLGLELKRADLAPHQVR